MKNLVILTFLIASLSAIVKAADVELIEGSYLGKKCGVEATIVGSRMKFEILTKDGVISHDSIPLFKFEPLDSETSFTFEREVFGPTGEEIKVVSGTLKAGRLKSLTIKTKISGLFNNSSKKCRGLSPQGIF